MKNWQVYLALCGDNTLYCGVTTDIDRRLAQHNGLLPGGARYTAARRPVRLLRSLSTASHSEALKMEIIIKKLPRSKKAGFFDQNN